MSNPSKKKGTKFETLVVEYLKERLGHWVERRAATGDRDTGDISGVDKWTLECKAVNSINLAKIVDEMKLETINDPNSLYGAAIISRRMKPVGESYVIMTLDQLTEILKVMGA